MALSAYLAAAGLASPLELSPARRGDTRVRWRTGVDPGLAFAAGEHARDRLSGAPACRSRKAYQMPHSMCAEEVVDISAFLRGVLFE
jgi:phospholipase/carboxylesterase